MSMNVEIIVGTYENFILGYKIIKRKNGSELKQSFANKSHTSSIKCLALHNHTLASGGTDDRIFLYDMKQRKEAQALIHHTGTINALQFSVPDGSHLMTAGEDGLITLVNTESWKVEAIWKNAHKGLPITNICCHPSGKLAISLGSDLTLKTWNLIKGRLAYTTNLKSNHSLGRFADCVTWSPNGKYFTLTGLRVFEVWSVESAALVKEQTCASKPICIIWINETEILIGFEDGTIGFFNMTGPDKINYFKIYSQRVKDMAFKNEILTTCCSSGEITLWNVDFDESTLNKICSTNIGCRPTCITLLDLNQFDDDYDLKKEIPEIKNVNQKCFESKISCNSSGTVVVECEENENEEEITPELRKNIIKGKKKTEKILKPLKKIQETKESIIRTKLFKKVNRKPHDFRKTDLAKTKKEKLINILKLKRSQCKKNFTFKITKIKKTKK